MNKDELLANFCEVKLIAKGGQKLVYSAKHKVFGDVVVKICFKKNERLDREIQLVSTGQFYNTPKIFETGFVEYEEEETIYIIEQKVIGSELSNIIKQEAPLSIERALYFLEQGLNFILTLENCGNGVVHRDIKPANIMVSSDDRLYFLDFGIARVIGLDSLTATEALNGPYSPGYGSIEQIDNLKEDIDSRTDIYSLGVVIYECLTGVNPFLEGASNLSDVIEKTRTLKPSLVSIKGDDNNQLLGLLNIMMAKYPSQRPKNAEEAIGFLEAVKSSLK
ncbi:Serine/threonine-protein kinase A [Listeria monocytogenes]|uniref:serine/threonine-protein kinase n=1 Tax=Listeria monocytogenes TaxID=1639 RepID=UPI000A17DD30|nr:serine/threonine-protein kinase [Listeria monocytogenes]ARJ91957.1 serine/threonine protein kinase [Listeria monocytogenes]EAG2369319.1 serine/threonine protein kinase [Listeria monocytogenes]EHP2973709.1 serine/threonine protein kinase [Listeria monocytogenes]RLQ35144.1 Serine/threonine-protein kinase A [Listeria monocytogenes]